MSAGEGDIVVGWLTKLLLCQHIAFSFACNCLSLLQIWLSQFMPLLKDWGKLHAVPARQMPEALLDVDVRCPSAG